MCSIINIAFLTYSETLFLGCLRALAAGGRFFAAAFIQGPRLRTHGTEAIADPRLPRLPRVIDCFASRPRTNVWFNMAGGLVPFVGSTIKSVR